MITQERLIELFDYREDGRLIRKTQRRGSRKGDVAGSNATVYRNVMVDGARYLEHRLIFLFHHGWLPPQVDHKDRDERNSRIGNLRPANSSLNGRNRKCSVRSGTGVKNVYKKRDRYCVRIKVEGKNRRFGGYATLAEAAKVAARLQVEFFGEFARAA